MSLSRPFIMCPVATILLMVAIVLAGIVAATQLPISALPQVDYPTIQVQTFYPGASPEVTASAITAPLERQFGQVPGLTQMTSTSSEGASVITLQFSLDLNIDVAEQEVQASINAATTYLPTSLPNPPVYSKTNPADTPILTLALTSDTLPLSQVEDMADTRLAQKISQLPGVGLVSISGGQRPAVRVDVNPLALAIRGLNLDDVRTAITTANVNQAKGNFDGKHQAYTIVGDDQLLTSASYRPIIIARNPVTNAPVRLSDVATVTDGVENTRQAAWWNEKPAVIVNIQRQPGANIIDVVDRVKKLLPQLRTALPQSIDVRFLTDRTNTIRASVADVGWELGLTIALVVMVIFLFLRNLAATVIPSVAVPLSLVGTFGVMYLLGYSLNNLSLMALTISTGFVVDDAIVMIENIARYIEEGDKPLHAALKGSAQIGFTILSLSVSLIAVLIPLLFMGDIVGRLFREFAVTLATTIVVSAVVSLTLTPMMCARLLRHKPESEQGRLYRASEQVWNSIIAWYDKTLRVVLRHQFITLLIAIATLVATIYLYVIAPKGFFPVQDTGVILGISEAPQSISFPAMAVKQQELAKVILADPAVESLSSFIGVDGTNTTGNSGRIQINLKPLDQRKISASDVIRELEPKLAAQVEGITLFMQPVQDLTVEDRISRTQYQYSLEDPDAKELAVWAPRFIDKLKSLTQLRDVASDEQNQGLEAKLVIDRDTASRLGITPQNIDDALYDAYGQRQVSIIFTQLNQYHVVLGVAREFQQRPEDLGQIYIHSPAGRSVPLSQFTRLEQLPAALAINHQGQFSSVTVSFNLAPDISLGEAVKVINDAKNQLAMPASIETGFQGTAQAFQASLSNEPILILAALVVVYLVLGVLYESYIHPITILSTLPSAGVGAILALLLCHEELSVIALIGIILLIGIVKKNAIMMIDFALEAERQEGKTPLDAIFQACLLRFRPIMMTTMAALLGGVPLALGTGVGSELRRPLGITIIGGLIFSQMLTLYTTPVIYLYFDRLAQFFGKPTAQAADGEDPNEPHAPDHMAGHRPDENSPPGSPLGPQLGPQWEGHELPMNFSSFSTPFINRPVGTTLLSLAIALAGGLAYFFLPVSPLPQVDFPTISVGASLPGANPETMASSVATPLERQFGHIAGITEMTSTSSLGQANVTLVFDLNRNIDAAARDVQAAINAAQGNLPQNLPSNPTYRKVNPADAPILILSLTSDTYDRAPMYDAASSILAQKLSQVQGVGQVSVGGSSLPAVRAEVDTLELNNMGLGLEDVRKALTAANANSPKGVIYSQHRSWAINATDQLNKAADYKPLIIAFRNGAPVRLSDVANVVDSVEDVRTGGLANTTGSTVLKPAVLLVIFRQPGANIIDTVDRVLALKDQLQAEIPAGIRLGVVLDRTTTIRASVRDVEFTLMLSICLVVLVVFVFLRDVRTTLIPAVAVPISLIGTFGVMYLCGYSIDNLSLMALTIATGFVVDDAIVVSENITRHLEEGLPPKEAALLGAKEIGFTIISISISLVAVFIPILLMGGIVGRLFREFAVTLSVAIGVSMVVSLTTTPMMCATILRHRGKEKHNAAYRLSEYGFQAIHRFYERTLAVVLRHRFITLLVTLSTIGFTICLYLIVQKGFFPQQDTGRLSGQILADQDSSFQSMQILLRQYAGIIAKDPAVDNVIGFTGGGGGVNTARMFIALKDLDVRKAGVDEVMNRMRKSLAHVAGGTVVLQATQDLRIGGRASAALYQFTLQGDNVKELNDWAPKLKVKLATLPGLVDVNSDQQDRGLAANLSYDRDTASRMGISTSLIDGTLSDAFGQRQVSTMYEALNQYHVVMIEPPRFLQNPTGLKTLYVQGGTGNQIPLNTFTLYGPSTTPLTVNHQGFFPAITISFNLRPGYAIGDAVTEVQNAMREMGVPASIHGSFQGTAQAFQDSLSNELYLVLAALASVYIVLGILYESFVHPITILSTIPSAGVGALLALLFCKTELSVIALIGIILLIGIVKKNAIMMIDFALEAERKEGLSPAEAIFQACLLRFRPITMTTMAALLGGLPLALGNGTGAELRRPLGIAIVGGLIFSQMLTLYTTPVIYLYLDSFRVWMQGGTESRYQKEVKEAVGAEDTMVGPVNPPAGPMPAGA